MHQTITNILKKRIEEKMKDELAENVGSFEQRINWANPQYNQALQDLSTASPEIAREIEEAINKLNEHETKKLLDGFSHPKDCEICKSNNQNND